MMAAELAAYVEHFQHRVIQDALAEATSAYWTRRAATWDHVAQAATGERQERAKAIAQACRNRARIAQITGEPLAADLIDCCLTERRDGAA